jgi:hypothetical protein
MAATKGLHFNARFRARIRAGMLRKRLQDHALGLAELSATQIRAAEILLKKCVPDLSAAEITGEGGGPIVTKIVREVAEPSGNQDSDRKGIPPAA